VSKGEVSVMVDDRLVDVSAGDWQDGFVRLTGLKPDRKVTITFPQRENVEEKFFAGQSTRLLGRAIRLWTFPPTAPSLQPTSVRTCSAAKVRR
jgi:hypothetical protein